MIKNNGSASKRILELNGLINEDARPVNEDQLGGLLSSNLGQTLQIGLAAIGFVSLFYDTAKNKFNKMTNDKAVEKKFKSQLDDEMKDFNKLGKRNIPKEDITAMYNFIVSKKDKDKKMGEVYKLIKGNKNMKEISDELVDVKLITRNQAKDMDDIVRQLKAVHKGAK